MIRIGEFELSAEGNAFIIAELSGNHNGNKQIAIDTIKAAKAAGADAIKLQTYTPDTITIDCGNEYFQIDDGTLWDGKTLYELYTEAYTPWEWHHDLFKVAKEQDLICFSSPFDKTAVDFLEELNTPAYKIASFEIHDIPLIEYVASKGKPIIISTGIGSEDDIKLAVETCRKEGNQDIILLKCTSSYPAPVELANLRTIIDMKQRFGVEVGLSDHSLGITIPVVATSLGAKVIEKHLILDKSIGGPDVGFSLNKDDFAKMVDNVRSAEKSLGRVSYKLPNSIEKNRRFARSLFIVQDVKAGDAVTEVNVKSIRPGYGLHPKEFKSVMGKFFKKDLKKGTPLKRSSLSD